MNKLKENEIIIARCKNDVIVLNEQQLTIYWTHLYQVVAFKLFCIATHRWEEMEFYSQGIDVSWLKRSVKHSKFQRSLKLLYHWFSTSHFRISHFFINCKYRLNLQKDMNVYVLNIKPWFEEMVSEKFTDFYSRSKNLVAPGVTPFISGYLESLFI